MSQHQYAKFSLRCGRVVASWLYARKLGNVFSQVYNITWPQLESVSRMEVFSARHPQWKLSTVQPRSMPEICIPERHGVDHHQISRLLFRVPLWKSLPEREASKNFEKRNHSINSKNTWVSFDLFRQTYYSDFLENRVYSVHVSEWKLGRPSLRGLLYHLNVFSFDHSFQMKKH